MNGIFEPYADIRQALAQCGEYVTQVRGVSMYPMLRYRRDPVLVHPVRQALKRYDVAVYDRGDRYVIHRILEVRPDCYVFRGDNCLNKEYIPKPLVVGVVVGFWRVPRAASRHASLTRRFIPVDNLLYRIYSRIWVALNPANVVLLSCAKRLFGFFRFGSDS